MGRNVKPGISFYRMDSGHIRNSKLRLLYNEFGPAGYWIWSCLLDYGYEKWGYYFDLRDQDEFELFCSDVCKQSRKLVEEVIQGCARRSLFDEGVAGLSKVLTSEMMQSTFLIATSERRSKGTVFQMHDEFLLLDFTEDIPPNIEILRQNKPILPRKNKIDPPNNPQKREDKNRIEDKRIEERDEYGAPAAPTTPPTLPENFSENGEGDHPTGKPKQTQTEGAGRRKKPLPPTVEEVRTFFLANRGDSRLERPWPEDKCRLEADSMFDHYTANGWIQNGNKAIADWQAAARNWIRNEMTGKFSGAGQNSVPQKPYGYNQTKQATKVPENDIGKTKEFINDMYADYLAGTVKWGMLGNSTYEFLRSHGFCKFPNGIITDIASAARDERIRELSSSNERSIQELHSRYLGNQLTERDTKAEAEHITRIARHLSIRRVFERCKQQGLKDIF